MNNFDDASQTGAGDNGSSGLLPVFAEREHFVDCAGTRRLFDLTIHEIPGAGFSARAHEVTSASTGGYVFQSLAQASLTVALGRLRGKIRAGLAQRFLIADGQELDMPLERLCGHIDSGGVVVDGKLLDWDALRSLLQTYEGWDFDLRIPSEDN